VVACQRCYQKKIKCSEGDSVRGIACRNCRSVRIECVYPTRYRNVKVSETYLKQLESAVTQLGVPVAASPHITSPARIATVLNRVADSQPKRHFIEETTGDAFVVRLRNIASGDREATRRESEDEHVTCDDAHRQDSVPTYEYFPLSSDQPGIFQRSILIATI
jgi:hypothetical protein